MLFLCIVIFILCGVCPNYIISQISHYSIFFTLYYCTEDCQVWCFSCGMAVSDTEFTIESAMRGFHRLHAGLDSIAVDANHFCSRSS